jgi:hypothetical protein
MARFPKIDQPCPLGIDEQRRIDGYCSRCEKPVHDLTAFDDDERVAFMRSRTGPLCVSYRVPRAAPARHVGAGLGAALAISVLVAHPAMATDSPLPVVAGVDKSMQSSVEQASAIETAATPASPKCRDGEGDAAIATAADANGPLSEMTITVGGVNDPAQAHFVDDSELPDLPMLREDAAALPIEHERANAPVKGSR